VPNPWLEQDEEKISKILAAIARANFVFYLACESLGIVPSRNAIYEISVPQINSRAELGAVLKIGTLSRQSIDERFRADRILTGRIPESKRAALIERVTQMRLVPLVENVGALAHLPDRLEAFRRDIGAQEDVVRVFVAMSDTAEQSGKIATDAAYTLAIASRETGGASARA
jgi:phosphoenolpyruvate carboxylase